MVATVLLGVWLAVFLFIAVAEMSGGDVSGAQHLGEVALVLLLMLAAWRYPRAVGVLLLVLGALLLVLMLVRFETGPRPDGAEAVVWPIMGLLLVVPPLAAGWLLWAGRYQH